MKEINLKKGFVALVDDMDYPYLSCFSWYLLKGPKTFYAHNPDIGSMHQLIIPIDMPLMIDHIDRNGLNNQRSNLRICTRQQNAWNQEKKRPGTSKYKGVYFDSVRSKWMCRMRINGITKNLGRFENEEDAAKTYDKHALLHFGEFSCLNFK